MDTELAALAAQVSKEDKKGGILLRCGNAWLSETTLTYERNSWQVSDMVKAFLCNGEITIIFKNDKSIDFKFTLSIRASYKAGRLAVDYRTEEIYYSRLARGMIEAEIGLRGVKKLGEITNEVWVATINGLIAKQKQTNEM